MAFLILWISILTTHAFNQDHCGDLFPKIEDHHPPYLSPLYTFTMVPSTTSYLSSFGKCSMYATNEIRNRFVERYYADLSREAAQGEGEYLSLLRELSGCSAKQKQNFNKAVQAHFDTLFTQPDKMPPNFSEQLNKAIQESPDLSAHCQMVSARE